ncbi:MAG: right-handed parallel beta-helix repeat-containing protein [Planctomycetota bacterium]
MRQAMKSFNLFVICLLSTVVGYSREYFVAVDGADGNDGSWRRPFRTIQKAADAMKPGDTCYVRGGVYRQVVSPRLSGAMGKPIRFEAWPGEMVTLSGTEPIRGQWSAHKGAIFKTKVEREFDQLFVDGRMMIEARWPNMRFEQRFDKSCWATAGKGSKYGTMVDPALAKTGIDWTGAVGTLNVGSWQTYRRIIRNHEAGGDSFKYERNMPGHVEPKRKWEGFDHYYLSGKLEALDAPTEWHLDRENLTLYLWTNDGRSPAGRNVEAKVREYAFDAKGRQFIELAGFHFYGATFRFDFCSDCVVDNCHLSFPTWARTVGPAAQTLIEGSRNVIRNCSVVFGDGPGVVVRGEHNTLENCLIHDVDFNALDRGHGVSFSGSAKSTVRNCTVFNMGSSEGLTVGGLGPSIVEYNYIFNGGLLQSDGGLIQCHGIKLNNTVIRYNWVHDHNAFNWGGIGIRGDDLTRNLLVHHNVVWNCREKGIIVKGNHNRVFNNTCLNNPVMDILAPSRAEPFKPFRPSQHPHLLDKQNVHTTIANNYARVISGTFSWQKQADAPLGRVENNCGGKDPMLVDPAGRDFRPRAGSPLIDAGKVLTPVTDGYGGDAPDIGAYEYGGKRWLPGCRNALWISAPLNQANGAIGFRVALRMPPFEPVTLKVMPGGQTLNFTPDNWARAQTVTSRGTSLRFSDAHLGTAEISDLGATDRRLGRVVKFDRPMLPTKPAEFVRYAE